MKREKFERIGNALKRAGRIALDIAIGVASVVLVTLFVVLSVCGGLLSAAAYGVIGDGSRAVKRLKEIVP